MDVLQLVEWGWVISHLAAALSGRATRTDHFRTHGRRRLRPVSGRPFLRHLCGIQAKRRYGPRCKRRPADFDGGLQLRSKIYSGWKAVVLPDFEGRLNYIRP